uniref:Uncharacterized protein n=1 Tax=Thermogemmatispora argillosa TaxID=2045280 RepID=A0A455SZM8_9CHLR|nr:hypothetical protein KTA_12370 [Thermogemmatispora argillosa]
MGEDKGLWQCQQVPACEGLPAPQASQKRSDDCICMEYLSLDQIGAAQQSSRSALYYPSGMVRVHMTDD